LCPKIYDSCGHETKIVPSQEFLIYLLLEPSILAYRYVKNHFLISHEKNPKRLQWTKLHRRSQIHCLEVQPDGKVWWAIWFGVLRPHMVPKACEQIGHPWKWALHMFDPSNGSRKSHLWVDSFNQQWHSTDNVLAVR
jgi:hypothetical protein